MEKVRPSEKADRFEESVIREMTRLANRYNAINLAQGFPDFPAPEFLKEFAKEFIDRDYNQYAITWGTKSIRYAISKKYKRFYDLDYDPESEITVCCGSTECMISAMLGVVNPGEEVIVVEPFYENYGPDAIICGAKPVFLPMEGPEFRITEENLKKVFNRKTKAIILNSPHNPTGKVFSIEELNLIADFCKRYDVIVITDEIYEHIIYDDLMHIPIATLPGMRDRTITISGVSKTFSVTGWRIGYILAPEKLTKGIRKIHDFLTVGAPAPLQEACAKAIDTSDDYYSELKKFYEYRRDLLYNSLKDIGFKAVKPEGAYYILCEFDNFGFDDDVKFTEYLIKEIGVAVVPGSSFFSKENFNGKKYIRFCFCKKEETLNKAIERLKRLKNGN